MVDGCPDLQGRQQHSPKCSYVCSWISPKKMVIIISRTISGSSSWKIEEEVVVDGGSWWALTLHSTLMPMKVAGSILGRSV